MDLLDALEQTFDHAHDVIAGVRADQYDDKTPCAEWTVRDLLDHMIGVVAGLGAAAGVDVRHEVDPARVRANEVPDVRGSAAHLHAATGWQPELPFDQTLRDTLRWWRETAT